MNCKPIPYGWAYRLIKGYDVPRLDEISFLVGSNPVTSLKMPWMVTFLQDTDMNIEGCKNEKITDELERKDSLFPSIPASVRPSVLHQLKEKKENTVVPIFTYTFPPKRVLTPFYRRCYHNLFCSKGCSLHAHY